MGGGRRGGDKSATRAVPLVSRVSEQPARAPSMLRHLEDGGADTALAIQGSSDLANAKE